MVQYGWLDKLTRNEMQHALGLPPWQSYKSETCNIIKFTLVKPVSERFLRTNNEVPYQCNGRCNPWDEQDIPHYIESLVLRR